MNPLLDIDASSVYTRHMTNPTTEPIDIDTVDDALASVYGPSPMTSALAKSIATRWGTWQAEAEETADMHYRLHMEIWNWFAGGSTAEIAADRVLAALGVTYD